MVDWLRIRIGVVLRTSIPVYNLNLDLDIPLFYFYAAEKWVQHVVILTIYMTGMCVLF